MIPAVENPAPLQGFIDKWLDAQPQQHMALMFVDGRRYPQHLALAALEQELLDAAYGLRERQNVVARLHWWIAELSGASTSGGQHPLTQLLFAHERARSIPAAIWTAPAIAAIERIEQGTAADFSAQVAAARPLHGALAALETMWWYGPDVSAERATQTSILNHLLQALRRLQQDVDRDRLPLPMARLAQHGLGREQLRQPGAARAQAVREQLADLLCAWTQSAMQPGPLSVFRAVEAQCARKLAQRAARATDSMAVLGIERVRPNVFLTLQAWRAARAWLRTGRTQAAHAAARADAAQ